MSLLGGLGCPSRWSGVLERLQTLPWPELYRKGPIGVPQPFRMEHGEWGPPMPKSSELDWELYSVVLICSDVLLTLTWHYMAATTLAQVRVKWMSPTFRVSVGYMFGTFRLSIIIYFFRAEPNAAYTHLHILSFILHCSFGLVALLFGDGPWGHLRPNNFGQLERDHQLNLYAMLRSFIKTSRMRLELFFWGSVQWFVTTFPKGSSWISAVTLHLAPGKASDMSVPVAAAAIAAAKANGQQPPVSLVGGSLGRLVRMRNSLSSTFSPSTGRKAEARAKLARRLSGGGRKPLEVETAVGDRGQGAGIVLTDKDIPDILKGECEHAAGDGGHQPGHARRVASMAAADLLSSSSSAGVSEPLIELTENAGGATYWDAVHPQSDLALANEAHGSKFASNDNLVRWFMSEKEAFGTDQGSVVLVGPANVRINVSQTKWNESLLFWARPSIDSYFGQRLRPTHETESPHVRLRGKVSPRSTRGLQSDWASIGVPASKALAESPSPHSPTGSEPLLGSPYSPALGAAPVDKAAAGHGLASMPPLDIGSSRRRAPRPARTLTADFEDSAFLPSRQRTSSVPGATRRRSGHHAANHPRVPRRHSEDGTSRGSSSHSFSRRSRRNSSGGTSPSRSAVDAFMSRSANAEEDEEEEDEVDDLSPGGVFGRPVRGTVQLRGDGILLSISTAPPSIREIYRIARNSAEQPPESREYVVELIGRRVRCKSGRKIIYTYAEYRSFGINLTQAPSATLLWLLNKLNGDIRVPMLRVYRHEWM